MLLARPWQFDKKAIHRGKTITYSFKVKGYGYTLAPWPPSQAQPSIKTNREGNTSEKNLFFSETWVESFIGNSEMPYLCWKKERKRHLYTH